MNLLSKIAYVVLAITILPGISTLFAYATSPFDKVLLILFIIYFVGLLVLVFSQTKKYFKPVLILGTFATTFYLYSIKNLYLANEGTDPQVKFIFSLIAIFSIIVLYLIYRQMRDRSIPNKSS